ncbi:PDZ domain-containing protein [Streptomyces sp. L2]|uniref:PDZ domain-containing protein n=1 Tax=Streptomyces sp. L2 TaxID=2162665 RepID=UPI0010111810|nr:PDZ domain-containing protein [Streptomyces sp. L2]
MEQTALRPKPMPGQERRDGDPSRTTRSPHGARRRGRRLRTLLSGLLVGTVLVLCGIGLGTVGATVIGLGKLADLRRQATPPPAAHATPSAPATAPTGPGVTAATLGLEAVDADKAGALVIGVHVPGPGYTAGLVRGDVLLQFGTHRVDSAADLARAVARAHPGTPVTLTVRHHSGAYQQLTATPGVVT